MLCTLLYGSKQAEKISEKWEAWNLPLWARDSPWMSVAKELVKCASPLYRAWCDGVLDLSADFIPEF